MPKMDPVQYWLESNIVMPKIDPVQKMDPVAFTCITQDIYLRFSQNHTTRGDRLKFFSYKYTYTVMKTLYAIWISDLWQSGQNLQFDTTTDSCVTIYWVSAFKKVLPHFGLVKQQCLSYCSDESNCKYATVILHLNVLIKKRDLLMRGVY